MKSAGKHSAHILWLGLAAIMTVVTAHALPDDRKQPIEIAANSAERNGKTGVTTYTGNVDIRQGSIHIAADTVVLNSKNDELTHIQANGTPATYTQQLSGPDDKVDASASQIHFDVAKDQITLQGNGSLKQQGSSISGDHIEYDTKSERVRAQAAESGSSDNSRRITVVIPPAKSKSGNASQEDSGTPNQSPKSTQ